MQADLNVFNRLYIPVILQATFKEKVQAQIILISIFLKPWHQLRHKIKYISYIYMVLLSWRSLTEVHQYLFTKLQSTLYPQKTVGGRAA